MVYDIKPAIYINGYRYGIQNDNNINMLSELAEGKFYFAAMGCFWLQDHYQIDVKSGFCTLGGTYPIKCDAPDTVVITTFSYDRNNPPTFEVTCYDKLGKLFLDKTYKMGQH